MAGEDGADGLTVAELQALTGRRREWIRQRLQLLKAEGRLLVGKKYITGIDGRKCHTTAYRILPEVKRGGADGKRRRGSGNC